MSLFSQGGGEFNGQDYTITGYEFTGDFYVKDGGKQTKRDPSKRAPMYFNLHAMRDGSKEEVIKSLYAGAIDEWDISDDGLTLTGKLGPGQTLWGGTEFATFASSALEKGLVTPDELPDPETRPNQPVNFEVLIGRRAKFGLVPIIDRTTGEVKTHVAKRGKNKGKTFKDTTPVIVQPLGGSSPAMTAGKTASASRPNGKAGAPTPVAADPAKVAAQAGKVVFKLIAGAQAKNKALKVSEVTLGATVALKDNDLRDEIVEFLANEDNIATIEGVVVSGAGKNRVVEFSE